MELIGGESIECQYCLSRTHSDGTARYLKDSLGPLEGMCRLPVSCSIVKHEV
jgi:hypothetical protein